jgi:hypothetical protein
MSDAGQGTAATSAEIKPAFSLKYFALMTIATLLPALIGGAIGYFASEYVKDKKIIDVSSTSSGNLISIADNVPNDLQVTFALKDNKKETIKGLFRYRVTVANRSTTGLDDFEIFLVPPSGVTIIDPEEITTTPPQLLQAIAIKKDLQPNRIHYTANLLNPGQSIIFSFIGLSQAAVADKSFSTVVQKKDWAQRDIANFTPLESAPQRSIRDFSPYDVFIVFVVIIFGLVFALNASTRILRSLITTRNLLFKLQNTKRRSKL